MPTRCASCGQDNRDGARYCLKCGSRLDVEPGADPLLGRLIHERYRVLRVLGEGGMGRVYLAEQQMGTAARRVALKILHASHSRDPTLRKRFYRECEVVIHLTHPNTIQFHDFGELEDGRLFIVMEYIEGRSLAEALREGPMPPARVERLVAQIAGSLHEAHENGVVHRDLKPENILLTVRGGEPDFVKVCDFGIAKRAEEPDGGEASQLTLQGTVIGTPQYMSPEQLTGGRVDARSDVYSLGLIVFEMLTGQRPFQASSPVEWAARHTTADPPSLDSFEVTRTLPEHQKEAVAHALAKLPERRPASARALAAELLGREDATTPVTMAGSRSPAPKAASARPPGGDGGRPAHEVHATAPTQLASPVAMRAQAAAGSDPELLRPAGMRSWTGLVLAVVGVAALLAAGVYAFRDRLFGAPAGPVVDAGPEAPDASAADAGADAGPRTPAPTDWIRIVHFQRRIRRAALALGPPDERYAIVPPRGTITLELAAGTRIVSDGGPGPDVFIRVDDERSGPYRADVGVERNRFTTVGSELVGSLPLDSDQFGIRQIRYVRIKNRGTRPVYLDAVGAYRTALLPLGRRP
jgi:serine/threonine-protein kinase